MYNIPPYMPIDRVNNHFLYTNEREGFEITEIDFKKYDVILIKMNGCGYCDKAQNMINNSKLKNIVKVYDKSHKLAKNTKGFPHFVVLDKKNGKVACEFGGYREYNDFMNTLNKFIQEYEAK